MKTQILEYKKTLVFGLVVFFIWLVWSFLPTEKQEEIIFSPQIQTPIQMTKNSPYLKPVINKRNEIINNQPTETQRIPGEAFIYAEIIDDLSNIRISDFNEVMLASTKAARVDFSPVKNLKIGDKFFINFDGQVFGGTITDLEIENNQLYILQFYDQDREIPEEYNKSRISVIFKPEGGIESANFMIKQYYGHSYTGWANNQSILMMGKDYDINQADIKINGDMIDPPFSGFFVDPTIQQSSENTNE